MNTWTKIGLGLAAAWYFLWRGANALFVKVRDWSFKSVSVANLTVDLNLNFIVKNPLLVPMTLKGIVGDVYIQGLKVGGVNDTFNYVLGGLKTSVIPITVKLDMQELGTAVLANIQSGNIQSLTVGFNGKIYVVGDEIGVPVQVMLNYGELMA